MRLRANRLTRRQLGLAAVAGLTLLAGCGGGADRTKARLRLVNATTGYASLDLIVDGDRRVAAIGYGDSERYVEVDPGDTDSELRRPGAEVALLTFTTALAEDRDYTVLAYGGEGELATLRLDDNFGEPDDGKTRLRVVNTAADAGALDVYITGTDEELASGSVPVQAGAAVGSVGDFKTLSSGTRRLRITAAGSKTDVRLNIADFMLGSEEVSTLVITASAGGVLVQALRLDQQGGIVAHANPQARVRVAAGVVGGSVSATLGGEPLLVGGVKVVSDYTLVQAGTVTGFATVGSKQASAGETLEPGGDYTLLVHGTASDPIASWLDDDNRRPLDSARAKVRLVHGLADVATGLSLSVEGLPVTTVAAAGAFSAYGEVPASAAAGLIVRTLEPDELVFTGADRVFVANACYTLFMLGASGDPDDPDHDPTALAAVLRQDR